MSIVAASILGASGLVGAGANLWAGSQLAGAEGQAQQTIQSMLGQGIGQVQGMISPATGAISSWTGQGVGALQPFTDISGWAPQNLRDLLTPGKMPDLSQIPGFAESLYWGNQSVNNAATAGSGLGGNQLAALQSFGGQLGMNAYNSLVTNTMGAANIGAGSAQAAAGLMGSAGTNIGGVYTGAGNQISNMMQTAGGNIAQTQVGAAQALGSAATGAASALSNPLMMMTMLQQMGKTGATGK